MDLSTLIERLRGDQAQAQAAKLFPADANTLAYAQHLDAQDELKHLRSEFILPTKGSIRKKALDGTIPGEAVSSSSSSSSSSPLGAAVQKVITAVNGNHGDAASPLPAAAAGRDDSDDVGIYFVGNSLGAQPKAVRRHIEAQLETWASIGVNGHFTALGNSPLVSWQDMAADCAARSVDLVGASSADEIVVMNTLTINLHLMMASFYRPTERRHKIICEWRPFPSDYYAIESQIQWHGLEPARSMVLIQPDEGFLIPTERILATIDEHADETALLLLPGIQYYSGQLFDIPRITAHARARGIVVGWDLAHAAGNVELRLHDWDVDFACWCTYKYINAGPGSIAGAFVHERHGKVEWPSSEENGSNGSNGASSIQGRPSFRPRLTGWYGGDKSVRFLMDNKFVPTAGAGGYQCSNPSAMDLACLSGALSVFNKTSMHALRSKALVLTAYAEHLLLAMDAETSPRTVFRILTPTDPAQRGTQLSVQLLEDGLLDSIIPALEHNGIMCDKRKPDVIRVAPVPLYSRFEDVWSFMQVLRGVLGLKN